MPLYGTRFEPRGPNVLNDHWLTGAKAHPVLFHSLVYLCTHAARQDSESANFLFHRGKAISHVRDLLAVKAAHVATADEVLATIALMGMAEVCTELSHAQSWGSGCKANERQFLLGEYTTMANHMAGMHMLVTTRGGADTIGFHGHLRKVFIE